MNRFLTMRHIYLSEGVEHVVGFVNQLLNRKVMDVFIQ